MSLFVCYLLQLPVVSLIVPHSFSFQCHGRATLSDCNLSELLKSSLA